MNNSLFIARRPYWSYSKSRVSWLGDAADLANAAETSFLPNYDAGYFSQKWSSERSVSTTYEGQDWPVLRYAEVLLTYAEALFEKDGNISDENLDKSLNLVRLRVNPTMPKLSNAFVIANGLDMKEEIRRERTIEFFLEAQRFHDLRRWKTAEIEMVQSLLGVKFTGTEFEVVWNPTSRPAVDAVTGRILFQDASKRTFDPSKHYLYPIPKKHLDYNPSLIQTGTWGQ
jgi:hypothetical protein